MRARKALCPQEAQALPLRKFRPPALKPDRADVASSRQDSGCQENVDPKSGGTPVATDNKVPVRRQDAPPSVATPKTATTPREGRRPARKNLNPVRFGEFVSLDKVDELLGATTTPRSDGEAKSSPLEYSQRPLRALMSAPRPTMGDRIAKDVARLAEAAGLAFSRLSCDSDSPAPADSGPSLHEKLKNTWGNRSYYDRLKFMSGDAHAAPQQAAGGKQRKQPVRSGREPPRALREDAAARDARGSRAPPPASPAPAAPGSLRALHSSPGLMTSPARAAIPQVRDVLRETLPAPAWCSERLQLASGEGPQQAADNAKTLATLSATPSVRSSVTSDGGDETAAELRALRADNAQLQALRDEVEALRAAAAAHKLQSAASVSQQSVEDALQRIDIIEAQAQALLRDVAGVRQILQAATKRGDS